MKMRKVFRAGLFAGVSTLALALALVGVGRSCSRTPSDVGIQGSASAVVPGTASPAAEAPAENGQVKPTPVLARPRATPAPTEPQPAPFPAKRGDSGREGQALPALADILPLNPKLELAGIRAWYGVPGKAVAEGQSVPPTHRLKLKGYRIDRIELGADVKVSRDRTQAYGYRIRITGDELAPRAMPTFIWIGRHVLQYTRTGERGSPSPCWPKARG